MMAKVGVQNKVEQNTLDNTNILKLEIVFLILVIIPEERVYIHLL